MAQISKLLKLRKTADTFWTKMHASLHVSLLSHISCLIDVIYNECGWVRSEYVFDLSGSVPNMCSTRVVSTRIKILLVNKRIYLYLFIFDFCIKYLFFLYFLMHNTYDEVLIMVVIMMFI